MKERRYITGEGNHRSTAHTRILSRSASKNQYIQTHKKMPCIPGGGKKKNSLNGRDGSFFFLFYSFFFFFFAALDLNCGEGRYIVPSILHYYRGEKAAGAQPSSTKKRMGRARFPVNHMYCTSKSPVVVVAAVVMVVLVMVEQNVTRHAARREVYWGTSLACNGNDHALKKSMYM